MGTKPDYVKRTAVVAGIVVALLLASVYIGRRAGEAAGADARTRLELLWPTVMEWPEADRAFLVGLAMTCDLHTRPATREATVACLREAASKPDAELPVGVSAAEAPARLDALLNLRASTTI